MTLFVGWVLVGCAWAVALTVHLRGEVTQWNREVLAKPNGLVTFVGGWILAVAIMLFLWPVSVAWIVLRK